MSLEYSIPTSTVENIMKETSFFGATLQADLTAVEEYLIHHDVHLSSVEDAFDA